MILENENLNNKFTNGVKWSSITEIAVKIVNPVTTMILARIISPEAFGVVTTAAMIMSFADMFTNAGFQKYLVQHDFRNEEEIYKDANVAFWTNLGISFFLWIMIILFQNQIAVFVGNPGLGSVIAVTCFGLLVTSFSSIQMALYRRDFNFKTLFLVRMVTVSIPFVVTIPLALLGLSYWSLIIGNIIMEILNAAILTFKSKWKPKFSYNAAILKKMLSFSIWSLIESVSIWFSTWADAFIIGNSLSQYYLGIYRTSTGMVKSIIYLVTASIVPVLFPALSRMQNDNNNFKKTYFSAQRLASVFVFPLCIGMYLYSDLAVKIMLGNKWSEAGKIIGIWAFSSAIPIIFGQFCSEVYRAKGRPKLSFLAQSLYLIVLIPTCIISSKYGFWTLVYSRAWIRMEFVLIHLIIMEFLIGISISETFKNVFPPIISAIAMGLLGYFLQKISNNLLWSFISIIICSIFYFRVLYLFPSMRGEMNKALNKLKSTGIKESIYRLIKRYKILTKRV